VVTSDDPRGHDINEIIDDVVSGISIDNIVLQDRRDAIKYALKKARKGDVVAILGRGVESKMRLPEGKIISFRDIDIVRGVFNEN
jgi:UDP-N-acetylmuramoyl-L-alanyl-D-glutamate--2,6-diaminopimelate ligase